MKTYSIAVLPGDGIGPEVIAEAERALETAGDRFGIEFTLQRFPIGAAGVTAAGDPFPETTRAAVARADEHRCLVAQDVPEHVLGEKDIERPGVGDQTHGGGVDV